METVGPLDKCEVKGGFYSKENVTKIRRYIEMMKFLFFIPNSLLAFVISQRGCFSCRTEVNLKY